MQAQQYDSPSPAPPLVKTADLMFPIIFPSIMVVVMVFTGRKSFSVLSTLFRMGGGGGESSSFLNTFDF